MTTDVNEPDLSAVREKYAALREAQRGLNSRLPTMLPKQVFKDCGQKLGLWQNGRLFLDREDYIPVFTDYAIYDYRIRGGTNAVERLWKLATTKPGTPEHEVLAAMQEARFTVLRTVQVAPGTGVLVDDLFYGERHLLADVALSENSEPGLTMAARLLFIQNFAMTTGAVLGMTPEYADHLVETMREQIDDLRGFFRGLGVADRSHITARLIRSIVAPREDGSA